jgi:hypothetical protein
MISNETIRAIKKCLIANGFDATVVDELVLERKCLRDEFAKAALQGLLANPEEFSPSGSNYHEVLGTMAEISYDYADAMLKHRSK